MANELNITINGTKRLLTAGKYCDKNIVITAEGSDPVLQEKTITINGEYTPDEGYDGLSKVTVNVPTGGGGECSGNHIIEVDELPTENIDINAVYRYKDCYYTYSGETKIDDLVLVYGSGPISYKEMITAEGGTLNLYAIPTRTTEGILETDESTGVLNMYYIEAENVVTIFTAGQWSEDSIPVTAVIPDISEIPSDAALGSIYLVAFLGGWKKHVSVGGTLIVTKNGRYDVESKAFVNVGVQPNLQYKYVTSNGSVTPDDGYDGLREVNVSVSFKSQTKSVSIVDEATITPDAGYDGLSKVTVTNARPAAYIVQSLSDIPATAVDGSLAIVLGGVE